MRKLKSSHRERKRYLLIETAEAIDLGSIILENIGVLGFAKACPKIIKSAKNQKVLAVNRENLNEIRSAFILSGKKIKILKISGSLKKINRQ